MIHTKGILLKVLQPFSSIFAALEAQNCFEGCSSNVSPSSDANGNNGPNRSRFGDDQQPTLPEKQGLVSSGDRDSEVASIDKHVAMCAEKEKLACSASEKESLVTTPADKSEIVCIFYFFVKRWRLAVFCTKIAKHWGSLASWIMLNELIRFRSKLQCYIT